ncbi:MAG: MobF family relaxase [Acidimicrobiales bacterium]
MGLSLAKLSRGRESYYLEAVGGGAEDMRVRGDEPPGLWLGRGARVMGLSGRVDGADLSRVLSGMAPGTGQVLRDRPGTVRISAYDATFAAPKSVSVLWAVAPEPVRSVIQAGHDASVAAALGHLEAETARARRGTGPYRRQIPTSGFIAAAFSHRTSRALDPHVHTHVIIANLLEGIDGRYSALDARGLYAHAGTGGCLYQAHLRYELSRRLDIAWGPIKGGVAQVDGITPEVNRHFSRRRQEVEDYLTHSGPAWPESRRRAEVAALSTRRTKDLSARLDDLLPRWRADAARLGLDESGVQHVTGLGGRSPTGDRETGPGGWTSAGSWDNEIFAALSHRLLGPSYLTGARATFNRRDVLRGWCQVLATGAPVADIEALTDQILSDSRVVPLVGPSVILDLEGDHHDQAWRRRGGGWMAMGGPDQRWTTPGTMVTQQALVDRAEHLSRTERLVVDEQARAAVLARQLALAPSQRQAIEALTGSTSGLLVATGRATGGAFDALATAREIWDLAGISVVGTAPSHFEAHQLQAASGIRSFHPGDLLGPADKLGSGHQGRGPHGGPFRTGPVVMVVMRAEGMGIYDLEGLMEKAESHAIQVVLVGQSDRLGRVAPARSGGQGLGEMSLNLDGEFHDVARWAWGCSGLDELRGRLVRDWWEASQAGQSVVMAATNCREVDRLCRLADELVAHQVSLGGGGTRTAGLKRVDDGAIKPARTAVLSWQARDLTLDRVLFLGSRAMAPAGRARVARWDPYVVEGRYRSGPERTDGLLEARDPGRRFMRVELSVDRDRSNPGQRILTDPGRARSDDRGMSLY